MSGSVVRSIRVVHALASVAALVALSLASRAEAQSYQGGVRGSVRDAGGVLPGTAVTLLNEATANRRVAVSNEVGEFAFTNVLPGTYTVRFEVDGYRPEQRTGLRVGAQQLQVVDISLEVGGVAEAVTVTADSSTIERATATVATALDGKALQDLPVFGRNAFYAAIQTPNVIQSGDPQFVRFQDQTNASFLSLGGGPRRGNAYLLEGVPITDFVNRPTIVPSVEAVEEVKVQVKTYDADTGRAAGGVFNTVARSGSNSWHGSAVVVSKPEWGTGRLYFTRKADLPKPSQYYYDWAGSTGGPILRDRTFFWFSAEGYQQKSTRNAVITLPTALERRGDFSQSVDSQGRPITIYDPLTLRADPANPGQFLRDPFPGNVIPSDRIDPVAHAALQYLPTPTSGRTVNGNASLVDGPQDQETLKVDHRWSPRWTTTAMYAHQKTREPGSAYFDGAAGDPGNSLLQRRIDFFALNNVIVLDSRTVLAVRAGYNRFYDDAAYPAFDAGSLGLPDSYVGALAQNTFPLLTVNGFGSGGALLGNNGSTVTTHKSASANVTVSRIVGYHTLKAGADFRRIAADTLSYGPSAGTFTFTSDFTQGPGPNQAASNRGSSFASFMLGYPSSGSVQVATPGRYYVDYLAGYVQDEFRLSPSVTLTAGLRYEFETGLQERDDRITVGFDRDAPFPTQVQGLALRGGLMYAGLDGYPTEQADATGHRFAPRVGVAWDAGRGTVVRGGWGLYWAPTQYPALTEAGLGSRGFSASTSYLASTDGGRTPAGRLSDPFPNGITQPQGNALGLLTGAGGTVDFVDQDSRPGYVHQYSLDVQRELPGQQVVSVGYIGSRSERLSIGGTSDQTVNINQLDPQYLSLGAALQQPVANPFFGISDFGNLSRSATIARGQLLRPYPQFDNVLAHRVNLASARYDAIVLRWTRRVAQGWGGDVNYTYSRLTDNQFGEANYYANRLGLALDNTDLDREYGYSLLDVPHRLNLSATYELPFGAGKRWGGGAQGFGGALISGWAVSVAGRYQTGFPAQIWQASNNSGLFGSTQRPNVVDGVDPATSGSTTERLGAWFDASAWSPAAAFTLGNAPRTDPRVRTPGQAETDLSVQKQQRLGSTTLLLRLDVLNLFDNPLFLGPVSQYGVANFGQVQSVGGFPRSVQLQARASW